MFEVGKSYEFTFVDIEGGTSTIGGLVESYQHPLVKIADNDLSGNKYLPPDHQGVLRGPIINVTSTYFVRAERRD